MLIYNYKKEFIGIDEKDLKTLGLQNLAQLRSEAADFADLFVKTPGYVHNFQHVHWIDYIACADSAEQPKVIINANGGLFKAVVAISTAYLADNPSEKAYLISLNHLRILTDSEKNAISSDLLERPVTQTTVETAPVDFTSESETTTVSQAAPAEKIVEDEYDTTAIDLEAPSVEEKEPLDLDLLSVEDVVDDNFELHPELAPKEEPTAEVEEALELPESIEMETTTEDLPVAEEMGAKETTAKPSIQLDEDLEKVLHSDYVYNPQIASDELGLPLDLIEEFIEDFINQAKEFKPELYNALDEGDIDNVKILSHKLKGVAANLRIEDALEVLTTVNTTSDLNIVKKNLDIFYVIIARLSGEEIDLNQTNQEEAALEDELVIDFKDDTEDEIAIADDDVPEQIELPELADDNFVVQNDIEIDFADELESDKVELGSDENLSLEEPATENVASSTTYSKELIAKEIGLDAESLHDLLEDFSEEAQEVLSTMKTAIQNSDLDLFKSQARQLKGMSNNIRFEHLSNELQNLLNVEDVNGASDALSTVETLLEQISIED